MTGLSTGDDQRQEQLRAYLRRSRAFAADGWAAAPPVEKGDDFGFMARLFLGAQIDHADSLLRLAFHKDCVLVSRSMLEGYSLLEWASNDPVRPKRWRAFAVVADVRTLPHRREHGFEPAEDDLASLEGAKRAVTELCVNSKKARQDSSRPETAAAAGSSDPYWLNWRATASLTAIIKEIFPGLFAVYEAFSGWSHWAPEGFADRLRKDPNGALAWLAPDPVVLAELAVAVGVVSLLETAHLMFSRRALLEMAEESAQRLRAFDEWYRREYDRAE